MYERVRHWAPTFLVRMMGSNMALDGYPGVRASSRIPANCGQFFPIQPDRPVRVVVVHDVQPLFSYLEGVLCISRESNHTELRPAGTALPTVLTPAVVFLLV